MKNPFKKINRYCLISTTIGFILSVLMFALNIPNGVNWVNYLSILVGTLLFSVALIIFGDFEIEGAKNTTHKFFVESCLYLFLSSLIFFILSSGESFSQVPKFEIFPLISIVFTIFTVVMVFKTHRRFKVEDDLILVRENGEILYPRTVFEVNPFLENNLHVIKGQYDLKPVKIPFVVGKDNFNLFVNMSAHIDFDYVQQKSIRYVNPVKLESDIEFFASSRAREHVELSTTMDAAVKILHSCNDTLYIDGLSGKLRVVVERGKIEVEFVEF